MDEPSYQNDDPWEERIYDQRRYRRQRWHGRDAISSLLVLQHPCVIYPADCLIIYWISSVKWLCFGWQIYPISWHPHRRHFTYHYICISQSEQTRRGKI